MPDGTLDVMMNLFLNPPRLPLIAPSILSADFARMGEECGHILRPVEGGGGGGGGADLLHLDVMDGHFVPNLTMGPDMCRGIRRALPGAFLDVHLMVDDPGLFVEPFVRAGANHLTFHIEVAPGDEARRLMDRIRGLGASAGVAINPPTPVERILPVAAEADLVLVMSVNPGYSGQAFIAETLEKTRAVRAEVERGGGGVRVEMDGGIGPDTAAAARDAGCDVLVSASAVFGVAREKRGAVVAALRG